VSPGKPEAAALRGGCYVGQLQRMEDLWAGGLGADADVAADADAVAVYPRQRESRLYLCGVRRRCMHLTVSLLRPLFGGGGGSSLYTPDLPPCISSLSLPLPPPPIPLPFLCDAIIDPPSLFQGTSSNSVGGATNTGSGSAPANTNGALSLRSGMGVAGLVGVAAVAALF
jgi:hypothetical protein